MFVSSSKQLWLELVERFGHTNAPQLFEQHRRISTLQQDDASVTQYFCQLKRLWDELQLLEGFFEFSCGNLAKCTCGILKKFLEIDQRNKLMQFLTGLHKQYHQVKTNILSQYPLPNINKAYHTLLQIEQQHKLNDSSQSVETSAFHTSSKPAYKQFPNAAIKKDFKKPKTDLLCDYWKKKGHSIEGCFKLVGYPN